MAGRQAAGCAAHARRRFEELTPRNAGASPVAVEALQRWARIYHVEAQFAGMTPEDRQDGRQRLSKPLWDELRAWLQLERARVAGGAIGQAIDYSLNHWAELTLHLSDGRMPIDNNHIEQQIKPWKLGANNANSGLMRTCRRSPRSRRGVSRLAAVRARSGLRIKAGVSCGGNPTSGDLHGCVRGHSSGAGGVAARQRSRAVRVGLRAPPGRSTLRGQDGACVRVQRGAFCALDASPPHWCSRPCRRGRPALR